MRGDSNCLRADAAGAVEELRRCVKALLPEEPVQNNSLLMGRCLPIQKQLIILGRQTVIKGLRDIHRLSLLRYTARV